MTRRQLLSMIGVSAGSAAMYHAMSSLGFAADSGYKGPIQLRNAPAGTSVLVLGAGLAGLVASYELRNAGYQVRLLEYNSRAGGRNWSLRGGDRYTELGGFTQECHFDPGLYFNPGPWRLPYHHRGMLSYCKRLGVPLEPFIQTNFSTYLHNTGAYGGKPQRLRAIKSDYQGQVAELLAKALNKNGLDGEVTSEDRQKLIESLRNWGALDKNFRYVEGQKSSELRGFDKDPGAGPNGRPVFSKPIGLSDLLDSGLWQALPLEIYDMQPTMFHPVGGMGKVGEAFARELASISRYNAKVVDIDQDERGVSVTYEDITSAATRQTVKADWCVCTIPLSILSQIPMKVSPAMTEAIGACPYSGAVKIGLQFKRRFWEEDEQIYGGISYTNLPIANIGYPSTGYFRDGKGVLLGGYLWGLDAAEFTAMAPSQRVAKAIEYGSQIHPQYREEFDNGISVAWHRSPFSMGCFAMWTEEARAKHYQRLCDIDGRIMLAGEHISYFSSWQEGALLSGLDAIERLHQRAVSRGASG